MDHAVKDGGGLQGGSSKYCHIDEQVVGLGDPILGSILGRGPGVCLGQEKTVTKLPKEL